MIVNYLLYVIIQSLIIIYVEDKYSLTSNSFTSRFIGYTLFAPFITITLILGTATIALATLFERK